MGQYLTKITSTMGDRRTAQIFKEVSNKQRTGEVKTFQEFSAELEALTIKLFNSTIKSSLVIYNSLENDVIRAETYNEMLDKVFNDFEVCFEALSNIETIAKSHEALVRDVIFNNIKNAIFELENKTSLYQAISKSDEGFNKILSSTFKEASLNNLSRNNLNLEFLYKDPRVKDIITSEENSTIDNIGERLTLGINKELNYSILNIEQVYTSTSTPSEIDVVPMNLNIRNAIDGQNGTYWISPLLFSREIAEAEVTIKLSFAKAEEINYIILEPILSLPLILKSLSYKDKDSKIINIPIQQLEIFGKSRIPFSKINSSEIYLTFTNNNPSFIEFEYNFTEKNQLNQSQIDVSIDDYIGLSSQTNNSNRFPITSSANRKELLSSIDFPNKISAILGVPNNNSNSQYNVNNTFASTSLNNGISSSLNIVDPTVLNTDPTIQTNSMPPMLQWSGYEFLFGLDNINVGYFEYDKRSVYVSPPIKTTEESILGLETLESRYIKDLSLFTGEQETKETYNFPRLNPDLSPTTKLFLNSIEYWIVRNKISTSGTILKSETFPILPMGVNRINHEVLVLDTKKDLSQESNDVGSTIFFTNTISGEVDVYKNGILLVDETLNPNATSGWRNINKNVNSVISSAHRVKFEIQILDFLSSDIFTVSYNPLRSQTRSLPTLADISGEYDLQNISTVNLTGGNSVRLVDNNIIVTNSQDTTSLDIELYLKIIQRRGNFSTISPAVEEYRLLINSIDDSKFNGIQ